MSFNRLGRLRWSLAREDKIPVTKIRVVNGPVPNLPGKNPDGRRLIPVILDILLDSLAEGGISINGRQPLFNRTPKMGILSSSPTGETPVGIVKFAHKGRKQMKTKRSSKEADYTNAKQIKRVSKKEKEGNCEFLKLFALVPLLTV